MYTINELAAKGAYQALQEFGLEKDVMIVSFDGGCSGVNDVKNGLFQATSQQYPLLMASFGLDAIKGFVDTGTLPLLPEGRNYFDTGVSLVTDNPVSSVNSLTTEVGAVLCWG